MLSPLGIFHVGRGMFRGVRACSVDMVVKDREWEDSVTLL